MNAANKEVMTVPYKCTNPKCNWEGELVNYNDGPVCPDCNSKAKVKCEDCCCGEGCSCECEDDEEGNDV